MNSDYLLNESCTMPFVPGNNRRKAPCMANVSSVKNIGETPMVSSVINIAGKVQCKGNVSSVINISGEPHERKMYLL